jgi:hypothetical protein
LEIGQGVLTVGKHAVIGPGRVGDTTVSAAVEEDLNYPNRVVRR